MLFVISRVPPLETASLFVNPSLNNLTYTGIAIDMFCSSNDLTALRTLAAEAYCRQIFKRAKKSIEDRSVNEIDSPSKADVLVEKFVKALSIGDLSQLLEVLSSDAVLYLDGGGKVKAPKLPIFGSDRISRFFISVLPDLSDNLIIKTCQINGQPGIMASEGEKVVSTAAFQILDNRIIHIYFVANSEKLAHLNQ